MFGASFTKNKMKMYANDLINESHRWDLSPAPSQRDWNEGKGVVCGVAAFFHCLNDDAAADFFFFSKKEKMNEITFDVIIFCRAKQVATKRRCGYGLSCSGICISWAGSCTDTPEKFSSSDCSSCPPSASDSNPPPSRRTSRNCGSKVSRHF